MQICVYCCSVTKSYLTLQHPWIAARQAPLCFSSSPSLLKLMFIESVMPSNHLILCHLLFLLPSIFPSIRVFPKELAVRIRWPKYWSFSFSISPSNEYSGLISFRMDWLISLQSKGHSRVFSSTMIQKNHFFHSQPSLWSNSHISTWLLVFPAVIKPWFFLWRRHRVDLKRYERKKNVTFSQTDLEATSKHTQTWNNPETIVTSLKKKKERKYWWWNRAKRWVKIKSSRIGASHRGIDGRHLIHLNRKIGRKEKRYKQKLGVRKGEKEGSVKQHYRFISHSSE